MKLLWLCNMMPGAVKEAITGSAASGGLWVDHVLHDLRKEALTIHILCPGDGGRGRVDENCSYATFREGLPYVYLPELEETFRRELQEFRPDVIHIWGTEYGHTLAMVNGAEWEGLLEHTVASIQGLCSVYAGHYSEGVPERVKRSFNLRDFLRRDNIRRQEEKFALRGELEVQALRKLRHVIGRTDWDRICALRVNRKIQYHFCNETLRQPFYEGNWQYETCRKHRIFASSCVYPVKGFHYLLEAFGEVVKHYPDATLAVPGKSFVVRDLKGRLRQDGYHAYLHRLAKEYGVEDKIEFLGRLSAEGMKQAYLEANVFVLPSTIENSPNSLGEAMLLGVPAVAADVGGVTDLMTHKKEGYVYQPSASYMLSGYIQQVFALEEQAEALGQAAKVHAAHTHDPGSNLQRLLEIYKTIQR